MNKLPFRLYLISDRTLAKGKSLEAIVEEACGSGLRAFQLREKDLPDRQLYELALRLRNITKPFGTLLFINNRIDISLAAGADGIQCPVDGIPIPVARKFMRNSLMGASTHSPEQALKAERDGADFITFGPIFPTPSKAQYGAALGLDALKQVTSVLKIPVFAIGGITPERAAECRKRGAYGVAVISAILAAQDFPSTIREFSSALGGL